MDDAMNPQPQTLSPSNSARITTTNGCNSSPEFEFWMLRNPSFPQPNLLSADELFVDGVLLPLHLLPTTTKPDPPETTTSEPPSHESDPEPGSRPESSSSPAITESSSSSSSASKRWKDIFKKKNTENNNNNTEEREREKEKGKKKKERKTGTGAGAAELNINIWPFSRSRSAGNAATRPRLFPGASSTRQVNSAPCSRSNSAGESKSRKWPSSPGRAGVHLGRSSPVWQVRRLKNPEPQNAEKGPKKNEPAATCRKSKGGSGGTKVKVLNLNVPMCIGYRQHLSCRSDENGAVCDAANDRDGNNNIGSSGDGNDGESGGNLFNLRNFFTKKSIVTSH